jgi:Peptidase family M28
MIDFRLYRVAWLPALIAFVTVMFSFEGEPAPLEPAVAPAAFDGSRAAANARQLLKVAPEREPGSQGDEAAASMVRERFEGIPAGTPLDQQFTASIDGEDTDLRNESVILPGDSERVVMVMAPRDSASGAGAASSAAATAALIELAEVLGSSEHNKTIVLVSTDGSSDGSVGAREYLDAYPDRDLIDAVIVIAQPGSASPAQPHVLRDPTDDRSTSAQLVRTAEQAVSDQADVSSGERGAFADLARLAMPVAAGDQSVVIAEGIDAVAISSAGEEPLAPEQDGKADLDSGSLTAFGSATLGTILAVDQTTTAPLEHGPGSYVSFAGNLIPGWAIAVLSLALLLPPGIAALDGVARAARRRAGIGRALAWAVGLALPLLATLVLVYVLAVAGLIARPRYPFDPGRFGVGGGEVAVLVVLAAATVVGYVFTGLGQPPPGPRRAALVPALGVSATAGALATWVLNPYLALLLAPAAHAWLLAGRARAIGRVTRIALVAIALLPAALALRSVTAAVGAGAWDVLLMIADGHIGTIVLITLCPLVGSLVGLILLPRGEDEPDAEPGRQRPPLVDSSSPA